MASRAHRKFCGRSPRCPYSRFRQVFCFAGSNEKMEPQASPGDSTGWKPVLLNLSFLFFDKDFSFTLLI
jgi:hypothetical protein